jgi:hypothetical protein
MNWMMSIYYISLANNCFIIYHQNICGLINKTNEIYAQLHPDFPEILCFTEHHLKYSQIENVTIANHKLGTSYFRISIIKGCVCIYVHYTLDFEVVNIRELCINKAIETCPVKCNFLSSICGILDIYRSPSSNFSLSITQLKTSIIKKIYKPNLLIVVCGDFNINYLEEN